MRALGTNITKRRPRPLRPETPGPHAEQGEPTLTEPTRKRTRTLTHWGVYDIDVEDERIVAAHPWVDDPDPSNIGLSIPSAIHHESRITQPMVRAQGPTAHTALV